MIEEALKKALEVMHFEEAVEKALKEKVKYLVVPLPDGGEVSLRLKKRGIVAWKVKWSPREGQYVRQKMDWKKLRENEEFRRWTEYEILHLD